MVYMLLGTGFEETEAIAPLDLLRRVGVEVLTVGVNGKCITGSHNIPVVADIELGELDLTRLDMIVLPGGLGGVESIEGSEEAIKAVQFALEQDRFVAAICAAPMILGKRGWLDGKNATCYPGCESGMGKAIVHGDKEAVVDGKIITGRAPGAAIEFGLTLSGMLPGAYTPDEIAGYMVYDRK